MDVAEYAAQHGLKRVGARPPLLTYLKETWARRRFIFELAKFKIQSANQRTRLGMWWVVVTPILNALVYGLVFGLIQGNRRPPDFVLFLTAGVFIFQFFTASLNGGSKAIISNMAFVQSLRFPRLVLPISVLVQGFLNFLPMVALLFVLNIMFGNYPSWHWLLFIPVVLLITVFNLGVVLVVARITVHIRDFTQMLPFFTRFMFYTSGIFFQISTILAQWPAAIRAYDFHPLHVYLTLSRSVFLDSVDASGEYWLIGSIWAIALALLGIVFFWQAESKYGRNE